jgi:hypothetical protein
MSANAAAQSIALEYELPHPPAKVWRALTDPALLAAWLMDNGGWVSGARRTVCSVHATDRVYGGPMASRILCGDAAMDKTRLQARLRSVMSRRDGAADD